MKVQDYDAFVRRTDVFAERDPVDRRRVSILGLAGEVGSLLSAVKKQVLEELDPNRPTDAVVEEMGDILWYCFSLAQTIDPPADIVEIDLANLRSDVTEIDPTSRKIQATLDRSRISEFVTASNAFPSASDRTFGDYQDLAFLTARTEGITLLRVCLAVLGQLAAEAMRQLLPAIEKDLNRSLPDRSAEDILGETLWHVAAIASLMHLRLDDVVEANRLKVDHRSDRSIRTPGHDAGFPENERFPRRFEVTFVSVGPGRSRMYWNGSQLGDELTDNAYEEDGYRFHDVLHLALAGNLGWSPVLRKLMGLKRRSDRLADEVEDGARATIVEELVIKAIHAEGQKVARTYTPDVPDAELKLFENAGDISYGFLAMIHGFVKGLEVARNRYWEWEDAIVQGCSLYHQLRKHGQGRVTVDLDAGALSYHADIDLDLADPAVLGEGRASAPVNGTAPQREAALREAALDAIGMPERLELARDIRVDWRGGEAPWVSLRVEGEARAALWRLGAIMLRATEVTAADGVEYVVTAIGDRSEPLTADIPG